MMLNLTVSAAFVGEKYVNEDLQRVMTYAACDAVDKMRATAEKCLFLCLLDGRNFCMVSKDTEYLVR